MDHKREHRTPLALARVMEVGKQQQQQDNPVKAGGPEVDVILSRPRMPEC